MNKVLDVGDCARCGLWHRALLFQALINAPEDTSHYATCPVTNQPILMKVVEIP